MASTADAGFLIRSMPDLDSDAVAGADKAALERLGLPDALLTNTDWRRKWSDLFNGASRVEPKFTSRSPTDRPREPIRRDVQTIQSRIWSGAIVAPQDFDAVTLVSGSWTVPSAYFPSGLSQVCTASTWIGIGGHYSSDLVQAGCDIGSIGEDFTVSPWLEWVPGNTQWITNFPIAKGDEVYILLWTPPGAEPPVTNILFFNVSQRRYVDLSIQAPPDVVPSGSSAEWIVEMINPFNGPTLARYASVTFTDCLATTRLQQSIDAQAGKTIDMVVNGAVISSGSIVGPNAVRVVNTSEVKRLGGDARQDGG